MMRKSGGVSIPAGPTVSNRTNNGFKPIYYSIKWVLQVGRSNVQPAHNRRSCTLLPPRIHTIKQVSDLTSKLIGLLLVSLCFLAAFVFFGLCRPTSQLERRAHTDYYFYLSQAFFCFLYRFCQHAPDHHIFMLWASIPPFFSSAPTQP